MEVTQREALESLLSDGNYVLFLGAGVSVEAGLRPWGPALNELAESLSPLAPSYATVMHEEIERNRYLHAAEQLYLAPITSEDRANILSQVFGKSTHITPRLCKLIKLPFYAIVTTNYDRSLIEVANRESVNLLPFAESDKDLAAARVSRERFILRIHGRIEVPDSIVLSLRHYEDLLRRPAYPFFVQTLITDAKVIFFGFSFADPYFRVILEHMQQATNGRMKHQSFALLSGHPEASIQKLLIDLNIVPIIYNPANNHEEAWDLLTSQGVEPHIKADHYSESRLRQYLASVLTHLRLQQQSDLCMGVLSAAIEASISHNGGGTIASVVETVRSELALPPAASDVVKNAIAHLNTAKRLHMEGDQIVLEGPTVPIDETSDQKLDRIVIGVLARAESRYGHSISPHFDYAPHLKEVFLRILVADGMSLAYSLIQRNRREVERVDSLVERAVSALGTSSRSRIEPLREAITSLLTRPETDEEVALDELALVSFVMCLTLTEPGVPAIAERIARHNVFLDASIVLPWISEGHPSESFYGTIVESFGMPVLADFYVNELVSHRDRAIREFREVGLHDKSRLKQYSVFYSLNNVNTFIGGYGGRVAAGYEKSFEKYLEEVTPFNSETEATIYLESRGVQVKPLQVHQANLPHMESLLADKLEEYKRPRNPIRIQHDARMVGYLAERGDQARPYFISADRSLVAAFSTSQYAQVVENILFPHQAFMIAQIKGTSRGLVRGLARTVFGMRRNAVQEIREFYIDRVLQEYEPALLKAIPDIVESIASQGGGPWANRTLAVDEDELEIDRGRGFTALDQFESNFHDIMLREKRKRGL